MRASAHCRRRPAPLRCRSTAARLDDLLDEAGMDAVVISSKHNIQYLFGGYRFFFFDHFDAIGVSRYLPLLVYVKGRPEQSTYIGHGMESYERDLGKFWTPVFQTAGATLDSAQARDRSSSRPWPESEARRSRARVPARRCGGTHGSRTARGHVCSKRIFRSNGCGPARPGRSWICCAPPPNSWSIRCWRWSPRTGRARPNWSSSKRFAAKR